MVEVDANEVCCGTSDVTGTTTVYGVGEVKRAARRTVRVCDFSEVRNKSQKRDNTHTCVELLDILQRRDGIYARVTSCELLTTVRHARQKSGMPRGGMPHVSICSHAFLNQTLDELYLHNVTQIAILRYTFKTIA